MPDKTSPAIALLAAVLAAVPADAAPVGAGPLDGFLASVTRTTLPNGLTVLVREQPGTGVVAINTWVKAGYFHEPDEVAGMAHLFEHMFFKGSKKFPGAEQISQELAAVGGDTNAGTIYDSTNYYFVVPSEGFAARAGDHGRRHRQPPLRRRRARARVGGRDRGVESQAGQSAGAVAGADARRRLHPAPDQALADRLERGAAQHRPREPPRLLPHPLRAAEHGPGHRRRREIRRGPEGRGSQLRVPHQRCVREEAGAGGAAADRVPLRQLDRRPEAGIFGLRLAYAGGGRRHGARRRPGGADPGHGPELALLPARRR